MAVISLTSAFTTATTLARVGSSFDFTAEDQALLSDDSRTALLAITPPADGYTNYLTVKNLATKVPMGSIIRGFLLNVEGQDTDAAARTIINADSIFVVVNGVVAGSGTSDVEPLTAGTDSVLTYGNQTSQLGVSLMAGNGTSIGDINHSGFGFAVSYLIDQTGGGGDGYPAIDYITTTIYYESRRSSAFWLMTGWR